MSLPRDSVTIRLAAPSEASALMAIRRDAILELAPVALGDDGALAWANDTTPDRAETAIHDNRVWVADLSGHAIGWMEVAGNRIEGAYVDPDHAGTGIGSLLLSHCESQIGGSGYDHVRLEASPNAEPFYRGHGYRPIGEPSADGAIPMTKQLGG